MVIFNSTGEFMIIKFKQTYSEQSPSCIISEQIQGNVSAIVYQEKVFEASDQINEDIIFDLSGRQYALTKIKNVQLVMKDSDGKEKLFELGVNEITKRWEMNGTSYANLKELYYDIHL